MGNSAQNIERNARRLHGMHEYKDPSSLTYESHSILLSVIYPVLSNYSKPPRVYSVKHQHSEWSQLYSARNSMGVWGAPRFDGVTGKKSTCYHVIIDIFPKKSRLVSFIWGL